MKKAGSPAYDILWELTCHYQIAIAKIEVKSKKAARVSLKQFADYLFQNLESPTGEAVCESPILTPSDVNRLITKINAQSYRTESSEGGFLKGTKFSTFLWQATKRMKPATLLSGYLAIWLKKCVVPHQSSEALPLEVLLPAVQLTVGVLHRADMMSAPDASDPDIPLLQLLEGCKWLYPSRPWADRVRQFKNAKCWEFYKCFPQFSGAYNDTLVDEEMPGADRTSLDMGSFHWLMNIRPGYNVFRSKNLCRIEPYFPCRFARQFGYDQLYVGNPNRWLITCGSLIDGVRAWFWNVAGCTGAQFSLPVAEPGLHLTFLYCRWVLAANTPLAKKKLALFESYIPETNTFLTKYGELGLPLHEMMKVSGLPLGNTPYQEYFPNNRQLMKMKKACSPAYDILWELTCHYQIAIAKIEVKSKKAARVSLKQFADYLFQNLESPTGEEVCESPILTPSDVNQLITKINAQSYRTESSEGGFLKGTKFNTFLWQATKRMKPATLLSGYLAIWLKRCVVPHQSSEALPLEVLFPAVQLVVRGRLSLLSAMIADLHSGLRNLANTFTKVGAEPSTKIPLSSVEFPYTYLMAWLVLHRSDMMSAPDASDPEIPLLQLLEGCKWLYPSRPWTDRVRQFKNAKCWEFYKCFPRFSGAYNDTLVDEEMPGANRTSLDTGSFHWLMNIRPGYNVFRSKNICRIEPYFPCRFARQFGYDQLYIGNPNKWLINCGGLIDGVRAWFWNVAGCTGARFSLPVAEPGLYLTFLYCRWILAANTPLAKKKLHELESEAVVRRIVSKKGKEPATSSRKGKQVADSEESDDFETSSEEDETRGDAEGDVPLSPVAHRTRRASSPKLPGAPSKGIQMKEKNIPLSSSNKMTLRWLSQEGEAEEEEEEVAPLINRKRSRLTAPSEVQPQPTQGTELRTKFRHESSEVPRDSRASKRIKKTAHRERQLSPLFEEKFTQDLPVDERVESEEEGEIVPKPSSPGLMDVDESSFTEQVHKAMNEEPLHMDIVPPPATTSTSPTADTVKLKEVSAGSSAANPATIVEDIPVNEPKDIELTHDMGIGDFDERDFDLDISEDVHQEISDILSTPVPSATTGPTTRVDSAEADASKDVGPTNEVDASTVIGECDQPEGLGFLLLVSPPAEVEPPATAPSTSAIIEAGPVVPSTPTPVDHEVGGSKVTVEEQPPATSAQLGTSYLIVLHS
ncbi:uncharacterized protein LOC109846622 [Asparagus officinalis]|uniref:uncharacterized protein LOC109846622 n=1 Tax=Asparagus officinalis TaxID=4686 RepID=UPI00098E7552|nr:uncharacterized protein LOC109846622 [Asparagus officinalis]